MESRKKVIIVGNGLGMALDNNNFLLRVAIKKFWESGELSTDEQKLISDCLPYDNNFSFPECEEDMDNLYVAELCCFMLSQLKTPQRWLQCSAAEFPKTIRKFIHNIAVSFHEIDVRLPESFMTPLINFIKETKSHIATLNYDSLLYSPLCEREICKGYDGFLVDGIWDSTGFEPNHLKRLPGKDFGYYLHLHGSPLFYDLDNVVRKMSRSDLFNKSYEGSVGNHLVLTYVKHKPYVISSSSLLSTYWHFLAKAISESKEIILFGYSGLDFHLNNLLGSYSNISFSIVEYAHGKEQDDREIFWRNTLQNDSIKITLCKSILEFNDWNK